MFLKEEPWFERAGVLLLFRNASARRAGDQQGQQGPGQRLREHSEGEFATVDSSGIDFRQVNTERGSAEQTGRKGGEVRLPAFFLWREVACGNFLQRLGCTGT